MNHGAGVDSGLAVRKGAKHPGRSSKRQLGMIHNQQWLGGSFCVRFSAAFGELARDHRGGLGFKSRDAEIFHLRRTPDLPACLGMLAIPLTSTAPSPTSCACTASATKLSERFMASLYTFGGGKKRSSGWLRRSEILEPPRTRSNTKVLISRGFPSCTFVTFGWRDQSVLRGLE